MLLSVCLQSNVRLSSPLMPEGPFQLHHVWMLTVCKQSKCRRVRETDAC